MKSKRVVVAMSGGVDSSVTAALLQSKGFEVIGITMRIGYGIDKIEDAKKVAKKLGISHHIVNLKDTFAKKIIANFCKEYGQGRTPNPCIRCNKFVKFGALLKKAKRLRADYIATGHYARIEFDKRREKYLLKKGVDSQKDQSYVLYTLKQRQLKFILMPLGNLTKKKVRKIAKEKGLPLANKPASQEICFIPGNDYGVFLKEQMPQIAKPGPIINKEGEVIGEHQGIIFYTVGQRKGMGIAARQPLYVISIDKKNNTIVAGKKEEAYSKELIADSLTFISGARPKRPFRARVKIRYLHLPAPALVSPGPGNKVSIKFDRPQRAITPGQAAVLYQRTTVLGGATIC